MKYLCNKWFSAIERRRARCYKVARQPYLHPDREGEYRLNSSEDVFINITTTILTDLKKAGKK